MHQYYVQVIAENYLKNLVNPPKQLKVHDTFLYGLEPSTFQAGYLELLSTVRQMYQDILADPAGFGMLLRENKIEDAKNPEYTQSHASFVRVPNLLLLLGYKGVLQPDLGLTISGNTLLTDGKVLKITKMQELLDKMRDYGFEILGITKTLKAGDEITLHFPENPPVMVALKALAEAMGAILKGDLKKDKNHFYMMNALLLESDKAKEPKLTVEYLYQALDQDKKQIAARLNDFIVEYAKPKIRMGGFSRNDWTCVYNLTSNKKVIMSFNITQANLSVKLNLAHIHQFTDSLKNYPAEITEAIKRSGWDCSYCHDNCAGPFTFELEGKSYNKCRCGSFVFNEVKSEELPYYTQLLQQEIKAEA